LGYENLTSLIGTIVSSKQATLRELQEYYSLEDAYKILEVLQVDAHNRRVMRKNPPKDRD
jgi:hypothetical protein